MKDGFDSNVAKKMPKRQKERPNRPWNVDPVQLKAKEEAVAEPAPKAEEPKQQPVAQASPVTAGADVAFRTIEELNSEFSQIIFEKKDLESQIRKNDQLIRNLQAENEQLKADLETRSSGSEDVLKVNDEIRFLNEQLQDADLYINSLSTMLDEKSTDLDAAVMDTRELKANYERMSSDVHAKAKLEVKVTILERDLKSANSRVSDLEGKLQDEYSKRGPLEDEITELKSALTKVHSSLAQIRLKAKREVYGS